MAGIRAALHLPFEILAERRGRLLAFGPVALGIGIGVWFALPKEPGILVYGGCGLVVVVSLILSARQPVMAPLAMFCACLAAGVLSCGARLHWVAAPMLTQAYYGPVIGRVVEIDRSQSGALRVTLDRVGLAGLTPELTPARVRVSLQSDVVFYDPVPGDVAMVTARLDAPGGAAEPGGFDFRRMAFFARLGAVGYARTPMLLWQEAIGAEEWVGRLRAHLSAGVRAGIAGDAGAFAAGVLTGDRSGLSVEAVADLRDSNLAHLLAISGMNMAFLVGFTFAFLRYGLALVPPAALRVDSKKAAAIVSLGVASFYLLLSGANVATERAFIMVAVMLLAVLLDRRAITIRSVAIAATILLVWQPEALLAPGFQMSFAATVALIAGFGAVNAAMRRFGLTWALRVSLTVVLASMIGGLSTAPYAAAHFNRFTDYGLVANVLTGPAMGLVVMPAGAMAGLLAPFGLAEPALWVMGLGCRWILFVANWIAGLDGSVTAIPAPVPQVLPVLTLGLIWLVLWDGRSRWVGVVPVLVSGALWWSGGRPEVLVAERGLVGVMTPDGRALSKGRGDGFTARNWLENDGDLALQTAAHDRPGFRGTPSGLAFTFAGKRGLLVRRDDPVPQGCAGFDLIIAPGSLEGAEECLWVTDATLRETGSLALYVKGDDLIVIPTHGAQRLWSVSAGRIEPDLDQ